ncbi:hypothetical protein L6R29_21455 [Myxococcota bacterium]|nr:hypothetical protein [Myxococcota bacterium]
MLNLYLISLIAGGALILVSVLFGGDSDSDVEAHGDLDVQGDLDVHADVDVHGEVGHGEVSIATESGVASELWLPFFSLRFWIFFAAFFGMTGTLLSLLTTTNPLLAGLLSGGVGFVSGSAMAWAIHFIQKRDVSSGIAASEYLGQSCEVLLPLEAGELGKIRVTIHGTQIELTAQTEEERPLERGEKAFVIGYADGVARIVRHFKELDEATRPALPSHPPTQRK